jgi:hypothetical protein
MRTKPENNANKKPSPEHTARFVYAQIAVTFRVAGVFRM